MTVRTTETDTDPEQYVLPLMRRHPELAKRLQAVALQLGREKGEITADDVHEAHPIPDGIEPRVMGTAFPKEHWVNTGRYVKSRRKVNHGRRIPVWQLRETVDA